MAGGNSALLGSQSLNRTKNSTYQCLWQQNPAVIVMVAALVCILHIGIDLAGGSLKQASEDPSMAEMSDGSEEFVDEVICTTETLDAHTNDT